MENISKSRFQKGQSGNPAGRKPGRTTGAKLRIELAKELPDILASLVKSAKDGDVQAAKLLLDRVLPALRPIDQGQSMVIDGDSLADQGRAVLRGVAAGDLPAQTGAQLIGAIAGLAKIIELDELAERITALEAAQ